MSVAYLASFLAGLLLAVRIMFFGAERRRARSADAMPLRRFEPALAAFLVMFGIAGYLLSRPGRLAPLAGMGVATLLGISWAVLVTRLAIMMARTRPEHDPDDPRFVLQGHVAVVTMAIPAGGEGTIEYGDTASRRTLRARSIDDDAIDTGLEVCIERVEGDLASVELWAAVEARL